MTKMFCNGCYLAFHVSERKIRLSDNDWFYCPSCGCGNTEIVEESQK